MIYNGSASRPKLMDRDQRSREKQITDGLVGQLVRHGAKIQFNERNAGALEYELRFAFECAHVYMRLAFKDWQTPSDIVILNMGTHPEKAKRQGFGSRAMGYIVEMARKNGLNEIRATQVQRGEGECFWIKNGFTVCLEPNPTHDFVLEVKNN